jgi:glycogen operon protein
LEEGVNFALYSRFATKVELLIYEDHLSQKHFLRLELDPQRDRIFCFWSVFVEGLKPGVAYAWRLDGPSESGQTFDPRIELLDPWAKIVSHALWDRERARREPHVPRPRAIVAEESPFDCEGDRPLSRPQEEAIIYELHVGGFSRHPSSGVDHPGTFLGLKERIPYLKELGITHVELLPIMAFDEQDVPPAVRQRGLKNFWGYSPYGFYALHPGYLVHPYHPACHNEFKELVKALHKAGIGVILDVVFNHTAEAGVDGPIINFKGIGNRTFYFLDPQDPSRYLDFTGCGNTVKANHPLVAHYLIRCLEYWVKEFHVDGFRFDLASVLARGEDGRPLRNPPIIWSLELSQKLERSALIAEAWDAAGLYQVAAFPGYRWQEWNGRYRDALRSFVRGDQGLVGEIATRISGSSDLYGTSDRRPFNSINFVTCHDGFTLMDLVSYEHKHNEANGEENRDGTDHNLSANYGWEGETSDPALRALRLKQAKNFLALLLLSQGVPMLLAGDEVLNTQWGNNNAWCQDNEIVSKKCSKLLHQVKILCQIKVRISKQS